ncbi:hypothetical protein [Pseudomonas germanica]|uniref:Uncharacterized protein n=1 Tax=Pseudomonas germanica TaxID=2815720 RepID=A0ABX8YSD2_9PSED|nr:hypothetical protein [Pseudomonas germanica]QYY82787.1 hypothetical protein J0G10_04870 [Pseudomonas germanica]
MSTETIDLVEARKMADEIRRLHDQLEALMREGDAGKLFSSTEIASLQSRLKSIKEEIKNAAKHGTMSRRKQEQTRLEEMYFGPGLRSASANFRLAVNANPKSDKWGRELYDPVGDLSYTLHNLEAHILSEDERS